MGTVFCTNHEEDDLLGAETMPCPLCGYGTNLETSLETDDPYAQAEDSNDALRQAMTLPPDRETNPGRRGRLLNARHYW